MSLIALVLLTLAAAQDRPEQLPVLALPAGDSAWAVRVETTGGFTGRGAGNLTADSEGAMFCTRVMNCPGRLMPEPRRSLSQLVSAIPIAPPPSSSSRPVTTCTDCVTTTMTVQRRDADGDRTLRYTWDVSTAHALPEEVRRLHTAMVTLTALPPR